MQLCHHHHIGWSLQKIFLFCISMCGDRCLWGASVHVSCKCPCQLQATVACGFKSCGSVINCVFLVVWKAAVKLCHSKNVLKIYIVSHLLIFFTWVGGVHQVAKNRCFWIVKLLSDICSKGFIAFGVFLNTAMNCVPDWILHIPILFRLLNHTSFKQVRCVTV